MYRSAVILIAMLCAISYVSPSSRAQKQGEGKGETFLDAASAGPDFAIQGEYAGELPGGKGKLGAQVIAMGDGAFKTVFLPGGLPGDGWDVKTRIEIDGMRQEGEVGFRKKNIPWEATIAGGALKGKNEAAAFTLHRVERVSPDQGAKPPAGATMLFDGSNADAWEDAHVDGRHLLAAGTKTRQKFQDFKLHAEWLLPFKPRARDQERGNSGIYIQDRYEVQILDTFGHPPEFNGCGATYRQTSPKINMCYPPLQWQTYDIEFTAAKFDASGKKTHNAVVTVRQNGVIVQDHTELTNKTGAGKPEGPQPGPIQLQGHGNPVFYRNIWVIEQK